MAHKTLNQHCLFLHHGLNTIPSWTIGSGDSGKDEGMILRLMPKVDAVSLEAGETFEVTDDQQFLAYMHTDGKLYKARCAQHVVRNFGETYVGLKSDLYIVDMAQEAAEVQDEGTLQFCYKYQPCTFKAAILEQISGTGRVYYNAYWTQEPFFLEPIAGSTGGANNDTFTPTTVFAAADVLDAYNGEEAWNVEDITDPSITIEDTADDGTLTFVAGDNDDDEVSIYYSTYENRARADVGGSEWGAGKNLEFDQGNILDNQWHTLQLIAQDTDGAIIIGGQVIR